MEKTGELAMWDKRPKSNLLLKSKIKTLSPKHNLPAGQVICYTAVFSVVGESPTTIKTVTQPIITWLLGYTADYHMTASQACPADCIAYSLVHEQINCYSNWNTTKILKETGLSN